MKVTALADFKCSFYGLWFQNLPDTFIQGAISELEPSLASFKRNCPRLYIEYLNLQLTLFLLAFVKLDGIEIELEGQKVSMRSLADSGVTAFVKKDAIDSNLSREYFEPKLPNGMSFTDFPLGRIRAQDVELEKTCRLARQAFGGTVSNLPMQRCGHDMANRALPTNAKTYQQCVGNCD